MHSFSNSEVYFNNEQFYTSNGLYAHKLFFSNAFSGTKCTKDSVFTFQGYVYETKLGDVADYAFVSRKDTGLQNNIVCYGSLQADVLPLIDYYYQTLMSEKKLLRSHPDFYLINETGDALAKIVEASFFTRQIAVDEGIVKSIKSHLLSEPVRYNYFKQILEMFIIPVGEILFIHENVFNHAPILSFGIVMNENIAFTGNRKENPFHFQKCGLREVRLVRVNYRVTICYHDRSSKIQR